MSENKLYKDIVLEVDIDAKKGSKNQGKETKATFYSYDINSGIVKMNITKDNQSLPLPNGTEVLINVVKLGLPQQKLVFRGDVIDGTSGIVHWEIPEQLKGYKGQIRAGVFINLPNGQRLHGGYFKFNMGISEIDTNLEEFEEDYWQGWPEFQEEAESEWSDWKAIRDDTWKKQEEDYDEWKKGQEEKQNNFENDYAEHWDNWKTQQRNKQNEFEKSFDNWESTQEDKQSAFEKDFSNWKAEQKKAQEDFEDNTNNTIKSIDDVLDSTDKKVNDVNNKINNLDAYTKNEVDEKLDNKTSKKDFDNFTEHDFLELEPGFENYTKIEKGRGALASQLQYFRIGDLVKIFGTIKNTGTIKAGSQVVIATLPYRLSVQMVDIVRAEAKDGETFRCRIYNFDNENLGNQIVMSDTRNSKGESIDFKQGKWLNVSLTAGIEVT